MPDINSALNCIQQDTYIYIFFFYLIQPQNRHSMSFHGLPAMGLVFSVSHDDFIKWKHFPDYLPFVRGFHRSPVNSPREGQSRRALMFSLICA